jgi:hypothetical protein
MPTYFEVFYDNIQRVRARFGHLLSDSEKQRLQDLGKVRDLFARFPLFVSSVDGLMEALTETDKKARTAKLLQCLYDNHLPVELFDGARLQELSETDRDQLAAAFAALYYISVAAESSTPTAKASSTAQQQ